MKKVSQILRDAYLIDWRGLNILECGAHTHGEETADFEGENNCWYIEANKHDFHILRTVKNNALNLALSDKDGVADFIVSSIPGNSSCEYSPQHLDELNRHGSTFRTIEVEAIKYESLLKKLKLTFDIVVLDIEGHEITVLSLWRGLDKSLLPRILVIECGFDWDDRLVVLKDLGYHIDMFYYNNCFLSLGDISKNKAIIQSYNDEWPQFRWDGRDIYTNHLSSR